MANILNYKHVLRSMDSILNNIPVAASFFITNRCNYKCEFCSYPTFNNDRKQELSIEEIEKISQKLAKVGVSMIAMIGGEPFIRKDIFEVVEAMSKHLMVQITTNGWFMDEEKARQIFEAGVYMVNVSLDSPHPEIHNKGRQNPQAYERALNAVKCLRDAPKTASDQMVGFESILSGRNFADVEEMIKLADELGVNIVFQPFSSGHIEGNMDDMSTIREDISRKFFDLKEKYPAVYNNKKMIEKFTPYFTNGYIPDCKAGLTYFNIDCYGNITRCEEQRKTYGNLKELSVGQIKASLQQIHRDTLEDGCNTCYLRTRGETEPLYQDNFEQFVTVVEEMFGVTLPGIIPKIAGIPGMKNLVKAGVGACSPLYK